MKNSDDNLLDLLTNDAKLYFQKTTFGVYQLTASNQLRSIISYISYTDKKPLPQNSYQNQVLFFTTNQLKFFQKQNQTKFSVHSAVLNKPIISVYS